MIPARRYDQVYVISDVHLGGAPGAQIFGSAAELAWFAGEHLAGLDAGLQVALVINGDFVDFLAEPDAVHFDPHQAVVKLERIASHFAAVFDALRTYVQTPGRTLIVNLGNHDIELGLPWVRHQLAELLTGPGPRGAEAAARLQLVTDGTGIRCEVNGRSVLCVHGNEVDRWNGVDFEQLRLIGRDLQLGRPVLPWIPNPGSRMVVDVMNEVKRRFPFVDLLKPETGAVGPVLAACGGASLATLDQLASAVMTFGSRAGAGVVKPRGLLGGGEQAGDDGAAGGPDTSLLPPPDRQAMARQMMAEAEQGIADGLDPMALVSGIEDRQLNVLASLRAWITGEPDAEVLREALEKLDRDRSFSPGQRDDTARDLDEKIDRGIDFLVAGHTHLERAHARLYGRGAYFNSGTWARLIRIDAAVRRDRVAFRRMFNLLKDGDMASLDQAGVVLRLNTVVAIRAVDGGAVGELAHVQQQEDGKMALQAVEGSQQARTARATAP